MLVPKWWAAPITIISTLHSAPVTPGKGNEKVNNIYSLKHSINYLLSPLCDISEYCQLQIVADTESASCMTENQLQQTLLLKVWVVSSETAPLEQLHSGFLSLTNKTRWVVVSRTKKVKGTRDEGKPSTLADTSPQRWARTEEAPSEGPGAEQGQGQRQRLTAAEALRERARAARPPLLPRAAGAGTHQPVDLHLLHGRVPGGGGLAFALGGAEAAAGRAGALLARSHPRRHPAGKREAKPRKRRFKARRCAAKRLRAETHRGRGGGGRMRGVWRWGRGKDFGSLGFEV